jgi:hypothetical protein
MEQSPSNVVSTPLAPSVPFSSNNQMPPLGPAPTQLPPLVHPPSMTNGSVGENKVEPVVPIQTQFESLTLNTPLQPPTHNDRGEQQFPSDEMNNDFSGIQESTDDDPIDEDAVMNPTNELSLATDDNTRGM